MVEYQFQLLPDLSAAEYAQLKADIAARGVQVPVEYDEQGNLLDGFHRVRACDELGIADWPKIVRVGMTDDQKVEHALILNLARRHLTRYQRAELTAKLREQGWSYRRIGERLNISHMQAQRDVEGVTYVPPETITGADGKSYPARRPLVEDDDEDEDDFDEYEFNRQQILEANRQGAMIEVPPPRPETPHVARATGENEWYTPQEYADVARQVMGTIDLDPASTEVANGVVGASVFYTAEDDGLTQPWAGRVWMNPAPCSCGVWQKVIECNDGNKNLHEVLQDLSAHSDLLSGEIGKGEMVFRLVQRLSPGVFQGTPAQAQGRSQRKAGASRGEAALQPEREGARQEAGAVDGEQPLEAATQDGKLVSLDTGAVGSMPTGMGLPMRVLWSGGSLDSGSLYPALASGVPGDGSGEHRSCMLELQLKEGQPSSGGVDFGQASVCPHCGAVGFSVSVPSRVFCNPPYSQPLVTLFADKLVSEINAGHVSEAIVLVNNATETAWFQRLAAVASCICFPRGRIRFWSPDRISAPLQGQAIVYIGPHKEDFIIAFAPFGFVAEL